MDKSIFRKFSLISTIDQKIHRHMTTIESEKARIEHVKSQREQKKEHVDHASEALKMTKELLQGEEKELFQIEKQLEKSKVNLDNAKNQQQLSAIEKEIETLSPKQEEHETIILELLEKIEQLELNIKETNNFLTGSEETLQQITGEVGEIVNEEEKEIKSSEQEIAQILKEISPNDKEIFELTNKKYRFNTPLVKIQNGACPKCGSMIDKMTISQVDKGVSIEMCPGCNRILLPHD